MNATEPQSAWQGPRWALAILLAILGMLGPFSIDTYIPAFDAIAQATAASPTQMQQTLSAYLFGFAFMNLFHGALSDSLGRRPVVLGGLVVFTLASIGCALAPNVEQLIVCRALQGFSTGAGIVVSRAVVRDIFRPAEAQRVMSQITIFFGVAPAVAPMIGGALSHAWGWHAVFWFLAAIGAALWLINFRLLPESLPLAQRQPFRAGDLLRGYAQLAGNGRFMLLTLASGVPFNGMFLYILAAPAFLGRILGLAPTQFFWFFFFSIGGIMGGSWLSGQKAGRVPPRRQIRDGFVIMTAISLINLAASALLPPSAWWAFVPIAIFSFGWALMTPAVTLLALDVVPARRGMASSLQAAFSSAVNGLVAGVVAPLVMHSAMTLALASFSFLLVGLAAWQLLRWRWPETGRVS